MYHGTFLGVYLVDLGFDNGMIGVMNCVSALSEVPVLFLINRIRKKSGDYATPLSGGGALRSPPVLVSTGMWSGCFRRSCCRDRVTWFPISAVLCMSVKMYWMDESPRDRACLQWFRPVWGAICGSLAGGFAAERLGTRGGFLAVGCLILILAAAAAVLDRYLRRRREADPAMDV